MGNQAPDPFVWIDEEKSQLPSLSQEEIEHSRWKHRIKAIGYGAVSATCMISGLVISSEPAYAHAGYKEALLRLPAILAAGYSSLRVYAESSSHALAAMDATLELKSRPQFEDYLDAESVIKEE